jgi:hypothetical protein
MIPLSYKDNTLGAGHRVYQNWSIASHRDIPQSCSINSPEIFLKDWSITSSSRERKLRKRYYQSGGGCFVLDDILKFLETQRVSSFMSHFWKTMNSGSWDCMVYLASLNILLRSHVSHTVSIWIPRMVCEEVGRKERFESAHINNWRSKSRSFKVFRYSWWSLRFDFKDK